MNQLIIILTFFIVPFFSSAQESTPETNPAILTALKKLQMDVLQIRHDSSMTWEIKKDMIEYIMERLIKLEGEQINLSNQFDSFLLTQIRFDSSDSLPINKAYWQLYLIQQEEKELIRNE